MSRTQQTETQTVLDHGLSVWSFSERILKKDTSDMKIPSWFIDHYSFILDNLHSVEIIKEYTVMHDCGKPYCLEIDENGKRHFPNHAAVSERTYRALPDSKDEVARLIGLDMLLHTATAEEVNALNLSISDAFTLLLTAFAEVHSNASMFGGTDSISFKSKWKKLDRRGKMLVLDFYGSRPDGRGHCLENSWGL